MQLAVAVASLLFGVIGLISRSTRSGSGQTGVRPGHFLIRRANEHEHQNWLCPDRGITTMIISFIICTITSITSTTTTTTTILSLFQSLSVLLLLPLLLLLPPQPTMSILPLDIITTKNMDTINIPPKGSCSMIRGDGVGIASITDLRTLTCMC